MRFWVEQIPQEEVRSWRDLGQGGKSFPSFLPSFLLLQAMIIYRCWIGIWIRYLISDCLFLLSIILYHHLVELIQEQPVHGSPAYAAPELSDSDITGKVDVYSFGVMYVFPNIYSFMIYIRYQHHI